MVCVFHQLLPPRWTGDSTYPWRATGPQASEAGRKGGQRRTGRRDLVERATPDNVSDRMEVHHTDGDRRNQVLTNLALRHGHCHEEVHRKRCS
jgi:hypothetical protein